MKKISVALVILIIFNVIGPFVVSVHATNTTNTATNTATNTVGNSTDSISSTSMDEYKSIADEGMSTINGNTREIQLGESDVGSTASQVGTFFVNIAASVARMISKITYDGGFYYTESDFSAENQRNIYNKFSYIWRIFNV